MPPSPDDLRTYIDRISLVGRGGGAVKGLSGFRKAQHSVPDAVNSATSAFLARLCATELADEAEGFFQRARSALGYKRAGISLDVQSPSAVLTTKDFVFELAYALENADPAQYAITRTLHTLRHGELVQLPEFDALFAGQFGAIVFALARGTRVEAVIDAIEALDSEASGLRVTYPSDCRDCTLIAEGVEAVVVCDGATLEMRFPRSGSPKALIEQFAELRAAFRLADERGVAALLR